MARIITHCLIALAVWFASPTTARGQVASAALENAARYEKGGVAMELWTQPSSIDGQSILSLRIADARSGEPLRNLRPKAWVMARKAGAEAMTEASCKEAIRAQLSGGLDANVEADLNSYRLLTLNQDRTITIINPLIRFGRTKLEGIIQLPGVGADWVPGPDKRTLFVSMPERSVVAVVDVIDRKVIATTPTGENGKPRKIKTTIDGRYVLVGVDEAPRVIVIDTTTHQDGKKVRFYSDLVRGKVVVINSFFATCAGACPPMNSKLARIQQALGDRVGRDLFLISISVDPVQDTPERLKAYAERFSARPGWSFLTGEKRNVDAVLYKLGQYVETREAHATILIVGNEPKGIWKKVFGFGKTQEMIKAVEETLNGQ